MVATLPVVIAFCLKWVLWSATSPWAWLLLYAGVFLFLASGDCVLACSRRLCPRSRLAFFFRLSAL